VSDTEPLVAREGRQQRAGLRVPVRVRRLPRGSAHTHIVYRYTVGVARGKITECYIQAFTRNRPISVYRLGETSIQSCGQSVSAPRGKPGVMLNAHTEMRAKRQRLAREAIYRSRPKPHELSTTGLRPMCRKEIPISVWRKIRNLVSTAALCRCRY
jgi:hypothetical protein